MFRLRRKPSIIEQRLTYLEQQVDGLQEACSNLESHIEDLMLRYRNLSNDHRALKLKVNQK